MNAVVRRIELDRVVNRHQIARLLGWEVKSVDKARARDGALFPAPLDLPGAPKTLLWDLREVQRWAGRTGRTLNADRGARENFDADVT